MAMEFARKPRLDMVKLKKKELTIKTVNKKYKDIFY